MLGKSARRLTQAAGDVSKRIGTIRLDHEPPSADHRLFMEISARQSSVIALLVAGALFMEQLDGTVIATALPQMANTFGVAAVDLNIGISAYLLTVAVFIPASGWVTDRFGARVVFASAIATFTIASIVCAVSTSL